MQVFNSLQRTNLIFPEEEHFNVGQVSQKGDVLDISEV